MSSPDLTDAELAAVARVLRTPTLSFGPHLAAFEHAFAATIGTTCAIAVNAGTSGLHLCVIAADLHDDDLVITTPFSFVASANCLLYERAIPIFVDVDPITGNLDPRQVAAALDALAPTRPPATRAAFLPPTHREAAARLPAPRALLPVHAFGQPADMPALQELAQQYALTIIEDACEAIGATHQGQAVGTFGHAAVFAFYPNKQLTTGEGGMIVTNDEHWNHLCRSLRNQGRDIFDAWLHHVRLGYNYRMDEMSAALGLAQLQRLEALLAHRAQVAQWYTERLQGVPLLECPPVVAATTRMSWFVYVVRILPPAQRNQVIQHLAEVGIPSRPYFTAIHLQPFYRAQFGYTEGMFPVAEHLSRVSLALPFSGVMTEAQVEYVCTHLRAILQASG
jgi:dTDP-4-amino-4,6-dideoxygalactose transaminase